MRAGEVVGVCGVEGNGQTELAECVAGMRPVMGGSVTLCGRDVTGQTPGRIREAGLSYIPEDRISTGMDVKASVAENLIVGKQRTPAFSRLGCLLYTSPEEGRYAFLTCGFPPACLTFHTRYSIKKDGASALLPRRRAAWKNHRKGDHFYGP